jgi:hypothetical protein
MLLTGFYLWCYLNNGDEGYEWNRRVILSGSGLD